MKTPGIIRATWKPKGAKRVRRITSEPEQPGSCLTYIAIAIMIGVVVYLLSY